MSSNAIRKFQKDIWSHYRKNARRTLPWRKTSDPYRILVSEVMLQQTQVPRVVEKYKEFLKKFPNTRTLARASLSEVLKVWSGLGYNRRAKYLHDAAKTIVAEFEGKVPKEILELRKLPGMGPYTASAVRVFAFDFGDVLIETNIRAAFIHEFYPRRKMVTDVQLMPLIHEAAHGQDPRTWNWALMDYGVHVKKLHQNPTRKSAHYVVQSKFEGSLRQVRGAILKVLNGGSHGDLALAHKLPFEKDHIRSALFGLERDGLVQAEKGSWRIA